MSKVGIMQPYFIPYIGYWQLLNAVDTYVIYDDVNYINRGWINRNRILVNGEPQYINIMLYGASQNKLINEIMICDKDRFWQKNLRTIEINYKKAPFYKETMELIERILDNSQRNLALFLTDQIIEIANYLEIDTNIILSSSIDKDNSLRGEAKILEICRILGAKEYYNAIGGMTLYSKERFKNEGIDLIFLESDSIIYNQNTVNFFGNLSIIDVLMFNGKDVTKNLLKKYHTI